MTSPFIECGWAHSCCSLEKLEAALSSNDFHAIESDIVMSTRTGEPCMAHPPATDSKLSFKSFLDRSLANDVQKDLKLDFKQVECVQPCLQYASNVIKEPKMTIFLNADVLPGPGLDGSAVGIGADVFLTTCKEILPWGVLSLGWVMNLAAMTSGYYTQDNCQAMRALLVKHKLESTRVVMAVHARTLSRNTSHMVALMKALPKAELLMWTGTGEPAIEEKKEGVITKLLEAFSEFPKHRIDFDVASIE